MRNNNQKSFEATRDDVRELNLIVQKKYEALRVAGKLKTLDANTHKPFTTIINKDECMFTKVAITGEYIYAIEWTNNRVKVTTTLHNNYSPTALRLSVRGYRYKVFPKSCRFYSTMNALDVLEAVIEFIFIAAVPDPEERDRICRQIMIRYRTRNLWMEKTNPLNKTRSARVQALPKLTHLNFYRAKQIWFQNHLDPESFSNYGQLPLCIEIYRAMKAGETFGHVFKRDRNVVGRPRGSTSRRRGEVIHIDFSIKEQKEAA